MRAIGITRKVDNLGRIVLPKELRKGFETEENETAMEIFTEGDCIILKKYEPACVFCGDARNIINYKGKNICSKCLEELRKQGE